jgi:head-tail adaptor
MPHVGELGDRVTVQRRMVLNVGGVGQESWPDVPPTRYPAQVVTTVGRQEVLVDGSIQTQTTRAYTVTMRYRGDVLPDDRLVFHHPHGDRLLQIVGLADIEKARWLVADCLEVRV